MIHNGLLRRLGAQTQRRQHIRTQIDGKDLHGCERQRHGTTREQVDRVRHRFGRIGVQDVEQEFADVAVDRAPLLDRGDDRGEVVVRQDHIGRLLRHIGAGNAHGNTDIGFLERGSIVHAVTRHGHDLTHLLERRDHTELLLGCHAGEDNLAGELLLELFIAHLRKLETRDDG